MESAGVRVEHPSSRVGAGRGDACLYTNSVQIIELVKYVSKGSNPFGEEEGFEAAKKNDEPFADETYQDTLGNLVALKRGNGKGKKILIAAHMDEIGVAVKFVDDQGFARFAPIGGIPAVGLIGSRVRFANGVIGVIFADEREANKLIDEKKIPDLDLLYIDPGISLDKKISVSFIIL